MADNNELIQSREDLIHYLTSKRIASKAPPAKVNVSARVRRLIMTDYYQGTFIHKGTVKQFVFTSIGGGVYEATIGELVREQA